MANPTCRMVWLSLVVSLFIYVFVAFLVELPESSSVPMGLLAPILAMIALGTGVGTLLYRRHALATPIQSGRLDPSTREGMQKALPPFLVNLVLSESVGVYGLVLTFVSGERLYVVGFVAAALVLLFLHRPTAGDLVPPTSHTLGGDPTPIV